MFSWLLWTNKQSIFASSTPFSAYSNWHPSKPAKCGLLYRSICDSKGTHPFSTYSKFSEKLTFLTRNVSFSENFACVLNGWPQVQYTYFSLPYAGKPDEEQNQYYVTATDNYTKYLVENFIRVAGSISIKGRNISLDRFFTSISIADWCLENKNITGTMTKDCSGVPSEMKLEAGREANSTIWAYSKKKMFNSYADKKKT